MTESTNLEGRIIMPDFSASVVAPYKKCLNGVPNVSVLRAIVGPGDGSLRNEMIANGRVIDSEAMIDAIADLREGMARIPGLHPEYCLAIRIYTDHDLQVYHYLNSPFYAQRRRMELLYNQRLYMRLLTRSLKRLARIDGGVHACQMKGYKGMKISSNPDLRARFDAFYQSESARLRWSTQPGTDYSHQTHHTNSSAANEYPINIENIDEESTDYINRPFFEQNKFYTFPAITSISSNPRVASSSEYCDHLYFIFEEVRVVNIRTLSAFETEDEWIAVPPLVVQITRSEWVGDKLAVIVRQVCQPGATYMTDDEEDDDCSQFCTDDELVVETWSQKVKEDPTYVHHRYANGAESDGSDAVDIDQSTFGCENQTVNDVESENAGLSNEGSDNIPETVPATEPEAQESTYHQMQGLQEEPAGARPLIAPERILHRDDFGDGIYVGEMIFDHNRQRWLPHGFGTKLWTRFGRFGDQVGSTYEGNWENGKKHGAGRWRRKDNQPWIDELWVHDALVPNLPSR